MFAAFLVSLMMMSMRSLSRRTTTMKYLGIATSYQFRSTSVAIPWIPPHPTNRYFINNNRLLSSSCSLHALLLAYDFLSSTPLLHQEPKRLLNNPIKIDTYAVTKGIPSKPNPFRHLYSSHPSGLIGKAFVPICVLNYYRLNWL